MQERQYHVRLEVDKINNTKKKKTKYTVVHLILYMLRFKNNQ